MKQKVNVFNGKKKNTIWTSGFQDKYTFYVLVIFPRGGGGGGEPLPITNGGVPFWPER